jgi:UPF0755 protein
MIFNRKRGLEAAPDLDEPEHLPPSPSERARSPFIAGLDGVFTLLLLISLGVGAALYWGKQRFDAPGPLAENKAVNIARGSGLQDIADQLQRAGVLDHPLVFQGGVFAYRTRDKLKAGEYMFPRQASPRDVMDILVDGKAIEHSITIPEGLTSEQIVARLKGNDVLVGDIKQSPREGSLLPETYRFSRGTTREQIAARMTQARAKALEDIWKKRSPDLPIRSPEELVVLASIVEKETGKAEERPRVAAVFVNRLEKKMRLQSDPTIIYGIAGGKGTLGRPLTRADITGRTPYNTYVIDGLPPGPIANPGKASLEAAANPQDTRDVFFVADGTGGHAFAETLEEHNRNVARWREIERQAPRDDVASPDVLPETPPAPAGAPPAPRSGTATPLRPAQANPRPAVPNTRITTPN